MTSLIDFPPEMELQDILSMLEAEDIDVIVQIQAVKVVAKLTIEGFFFCKLYSTLTYILLFLIG